MTTKPNEHDQDSEPPTPDGREPKPAHIDPDDPTPASDPDPTPPESID